MSKKKLVLKIFLWAISVIAALIIVLIVGAYGYFRFVIAPKLAENDENSIDNAISFTEVAKEVSDKQIIDNIINFDKQSASEMLVALNELGEEVKANNTENNTEKAPTNKEPETTAVPAEPQVEKEGSTAYQRIMNTASKDEISRGMAIISKVDISKVNELRRQGKNSEIKEYIKSVLTSSEISAALDLYNKYKHLL